MDDPFEIVHQGIWLGIRLGLLPSKEITDCLAVVPKGYYVLKDQVTHFHPLESVLVGEWSNGDWKADAMTKLGVTQQWIEGFMQGFARQPEASINQDYVQGFLTAECLRQKYPRSLGEC